MFRYAIKIEYDGTNFHGWQKQNSVATVQGTINQALDNLNTSGIGVIGAGRTDAGVHALGQVAHFDMPKKWEPIELQNALNYYLKSELISVISISETPTDFHARFSARKRHYLFKMLIRRPPLTLNKHRFWHVRRSQGIAQMREAAKNLVGQHDFTTFRSSICQAKSPIKTIDSISIHKHSNKNESIIEIRIQARSFLHNQVRSIVGTLEKVGSGFWTPNDVAEAIEAKDRARCGPVAPAHGLYLENVLYDEISF
ncbi:MAG: tRNA pseudouridine(38-40) synthase TruA [Pseudomonadota bacterium]|nr:tRNA pseudouridine(38-40) synthase TruA [Pseudomonadota bacterium]